MSDEVIIVYATDWCGDCRRTRRFLDRHAIPYQWINIDHDSAGEDFVRQTNHGNRSVPTIVLPGGKILVEPSDLQLEQNLLAG
jgi:glutaredoxin-like protein